MAGRGIAETRVPNACSLVDILPTMLDLAAAGGAAKPELGQPIDGRSLLPVASGAGDTGDEALGEYCAEMTAHPVFMIRRGRFKYIHCDGDPPQLFDLEADPEERTNLAGSDEHTALAAGFAEEVAARWDSAKIRADVINTQKQRRAVYAAMQAGALTAWDYNPPRDAAQEYVRNHMDWTVAAARTRFPPLAE